MPEFPSQPDAREVDRVEALVTVDDSARVQEFLDLCNPGSEWSVRIRTAEVSATVIRRKPLGTFDESVCTCVSLWLTRAVPVEPGLRIKVVALDDERLSATAVIRPWDS